MSSPPEQSEERLTIPIQEQEVFSTATTDAATTATTTTLATEPSMPTTAIATATAATMDEGIYGFNKKLIDTVYDVICFLYPVKGNDRDFARFYVLETVARVPYFVSS